MKWIYRYLGSAACRSTGTVGGGDEGAARARNPHVFGEPVLTGVRFRISSCGRLVMIMERRSASPWPWQIPAAQVGEPPPKIRRGHLRLRPDGGGLRGPGAGRQQAAQAAMSRRCSGAHRQVLTQRETNLNLPGSPRRRRLDAVDAVATRLARVSVPRRRGLRGHVRCIWCR